MKTTQRYAKWWKERKINWVHDYLSTWQHLHRNLIIQKLKEIRWFSLLELGCGAGENLLKIQTEFPKADLGGIDINRDAMKVAQSVGIQINERLEKKGKHWFLETRDIQKGIFLSDNGVDVVLSDMFFIYVGPFKISKILKEVKRIARFNVIFVEFNHRNFWERLKLWFRSGYFSYHWEKLLEKNGFYDIQVSKMKEEDWPNGEPQKTYGAIITAKV